MPHAVLGQPSIPHLEASVATNLAAYRTMKCNGTGSTAVVAMSSSQLVRMTFTKCVGWLQEFGAVNMTC